MSDERDVNSRRRTNQREHQVENAGVRDERAHLCSLLPSAASFIAQLRQRGWAVQKADNDVLDGIREVARRLGAGELVFHCSCEHTLDEMQSYVWDEKAGQRGEDKPVKVNDHGADACRYFVSTILGRQVVSARRRPRGV